MTLRIAVSEKNETIRQEIRYLVEEHPDYVFTGDSADEYSVMSLVEDTRPSIIALDRDLTLQSNLLPAIRKFHPDLKIIYMTKTGNRDVVLEIYKYRIEACIIKRNIFNEFFMAIEGITQNHRFLSSEITTAIVEEYIEAGSGL